MKTPLQRLTPFRFVAALLVVLFHFGNMIPELSASWMNTIVAHGNLAVSFFYCLSGFIMASVYRSPMDRANRKEYWIARFSRIYPVYIICLVLSIFLVSQGTPKQVILSALLLQSWVPGYSLLLNAPGWSLSVEVLFYALFPFMTVLIASSSAARLLAITAVLWVSTQFLSFYLITYHYHGYPSRSHDFIFYFPLMHFSEFVLGAYFAVLMVRHIMSWRRLGYAVLACMALIEVMVRTANLFGLRTIAENGLYAPLFLCAMCAVVMLPSAKLLETRVAVLLGESSYSMYLLQMPVFVFAEKSFTRLSHSQIFCVCLAGLVALSMVCHLFVEQPARSLIRKSQ